MAITQNSINYEKLVSEVMHSIVKKSLECVRNDQLPGAHHFYISFLTEYPGVIISDRLKAKYQKEITIVIQYQFENLKVEQCKFSVTLIFDGTKEFIEVPYLALTSFSDPSVSFGLKFNPPRPLQKSYEYLADKNKAPQKLIGDEQNLSPTTSSDNVIALDKFRKKK